MDTELSVAERAEVHRALGEPHRLAIVDELRRSDCTPSELKDRVGLASSLLAFHLDVLEEAGLIVRRKSQGDARRRYLSLVPLPRRWPFNDLPSPEGPVLFVCTRNAARSQFAAALWTDRTGHPGWSAGSAPAIAVDELTVVVAADHGLPLPVDPPRHLDDVPSVPPLVVTVCDRARESGLPWPVAPVHWSIDDPIAGDRRSYEAAFDEIAGRIDLLAGSAGRASA